MLIIGAKVESSKNSKYDFKTLKVRPSTYKRLVKYKGLLESDRQELQSFDTIISYILDKVELFPANDINKYELPKKYG